MLLVYQSCPERVTVVVGGVIPVKDIPVLKQIGVAGVFPGGTPFEDSIKFIKEDTSK
jgi:methylmalonyl-CoA mutase C-terminal domain/subunit